MPSRTSQSLAEASQAPETKSLVSGARDRLMTSPVWPVKVVVCWPVSMSHKALQWGHRTGPVRGHSIYSHRDPQCVLTGHGWKHQDLWSQGWVKTHYKVVELQGPGRAQRATSRMAFHCSELGPIWGSIQGLQIKCRRVETQEETSSEVATNLSSAWSEHKSAHWKGA